MPPLGNGAEQTSARVRPGRTESPSYQGGAPPLPAPVEGASQPTEHRRPGCRSIGLRCPDLWGTLATLAALGFLANCTVAKGTKTENQEIAQQTDGATSASPFEEFDAGRFVQPTRINNPWMPMTPGTRYVYEGITLEDDGTPVPHRVVINVTDLTKVIGGVRSVVSWDLDYSNGELVEGDLAFYAQDSDGNVWLMGEYPEEYDAGKLVANPGWIHGIEDARAGIMMKAKPEPRTPSYSEGWGPAVKWTDRGQVDQIGQKTCVPVDCYEDVLVIAETSQSEPDAQQIKFYARGVGNVRVGWRGAGEKTKETLELVKIERLDAKALAELRAKTLELEKSGYKNSKNVYAQTPPSQPASEPS